MPKIEQITVFGGTGFIGRHLIRRLAKTGAIIRVPNIEPERASILKPMGDVGQIVPFACSSRSDAAVGDAIGHADAVINLIGILHKKGSNTFQNVHVETAARIARLAKQNGARHLVHISALGANENSASSYARSKAAGEHAVHTFFPDAAIMRPSVVFGPEDKFFNMFAALAIKSPVLPLIGGGVTKFQPVYVGDVADAIIAALEKPEARGHIFELGGPQVYTFHELMKLMLKVIDRRRFFVNLSWPLAKIQAALMECMPSPLLTRDQVELLKADNIVQTNAKILRDLGIAPTALEVILPTYLNRFRKN